MDNNISNVAIDRNNNKWFGMAHWGSVKGVNRFDGTSWSYYNTINSGIASDTIVAIASDSEGSVWFGHGTSGKGVSNFNGANWSIYNTVNSGLGDDTVIDIAVASDGAIWFLGSKISKFDGSNWTVYEIPSSSRMECIAAEGSDKIWVGTYGEGVLSFDGTDWINYNAKNSSIGYPFIVDILVDSRGNKWFAPQDYGGGVSVFNENGVCVGIEDPI